MSLSLQKWRAERLPALRELDAARRGLSGSKRGRRFAVRQIHESYVVLLSSHFQGFCRDLHDECADFFVQTVPMVKLRTALRDVVLLNRKLDSGNPNPGNIGSDFGRFGLPFWAEVRAFDAQNQNRQQSLEAMNSWRNAIAHQHFDPAKLGGAALRLHLLREWRAACDKLASSFDAVMRSHLTTINGSAPW
jgi:hypothetical protein